jgi:hypothetical protein
MLASLGDQHAHPARERPKTQVTVRIDRIDVIAERPAVQPPLRPHHSVARRVLTLDEYLAQVRRRA